MCETCVIREVLGFIH